MFTSLGNLLCQQGVKILFFANLVEVDVVVEADPGQGLLDQLAVRRVEEEGVEGIQVDIGVTPGGGLGAVLGVASVQARQVRPYKRQVFLDAEVLIPEKKVEPSMLMMQEVKYRRVQLLIYI